MPADAPDPHQTFRTLAARQSGWAFRSQLLSAGVSAHWIDYQVKRERLVRRGRGAYSLLPQPGERARWIHCLLTCGPDGTLSHWTAAAVTRQLPAVRVADPVHLTVPFTAQRRIAGAVVHRARRLLPHEITTSDGLRLTTPARTLLDLASGCTDRELENALANSYELGCATSHDIVRLLHDHPRHPGAARLRRLGCPAGSPTRLRSEAEAGFLDLVRRAGLENPEVNTRLHGFEVDFLWRHARLVVEVDGREWHGTPRAFERDRLRDATLVAAGIRVMRVTWRQLATGREALLVRLTRALMGK